MTEPDTYLQVRVREALATDPRVAQPGLRVEVHGRTVQISGRVGSEERKRAVGEVANEMCPEHDIRNRVEVVDLRELEAGEEERL